LVGGDEVDATVAVEVAGQQDVGLVAGLVGHGVGKRHGGEREAHVAAGDAVAADAVAAGDAVPRARALAGAGGAAAVDVGLVLILDAVLAGQRRALAAFAGGVLAVGVDLAAVADLARAAGAAAVDVGLLAVADLIVAQRVEVEHAAGGVEAG